MSLHASTFEYLKPSESQGDSMADIRAEFSSLARYLDHKLPEGPDKQHVMRLVRTAGMWANVALMRFHDGTPRNENS